MPVETYSSRGILIEIAIRIVLLLAFIISEFAEPFERKIQPEEAWLYRYPKTPSFVPVHYLWTIVFLIPLCVLALTYFIRNDKTDFVEAVLSFTLLLGINGVITNFIKLVVGRPRPDFFWRCFPNGIGNFEMKCTGKHEDIIEGMKSFPSGHSSFSLASLGFTTFYLCGKLHVFNWKYQRQSWRLLASVCPILGGLLIALSRTCDYHHHWQDVLVGSLLGIFLSWLCYRQYYPPLTHTHCNQPYISLGNWLGVNHISDCSKKEEHFTDPAIKWI